MKQHKKDLQAVTKEFKALTKKMSQLTAKVRKTAVDELHHAQAAVKLKPPAQHAAGALKTLTEQTDKLIRAVDKFEAAKAARRKKTKPKVPAKRVLSKKAPAKRPAGKRPVAATNEILKIIKRSKKGVDVSTLVKKTGLAQSTVRNIVSRAAKQGKIKRVGRGIYVGA